MTPPLRSIRSEAAACRAAWKTAPDATHAWHLHHDQLIEALRQPAANRIAYILRHKPKDERALRLRLFRPVSAEAAKAVATAEAAYEKATAPARATYEQVIATALATYQQVIAPARAARDKAVAPAWATYEQVIATAHAAECPDCPWDGRTIFTEETP